MTDDESTVHDLLTRAAPSFDALDGHLIRERATFHRPSVLRSRRIGFSAGIAATVLAVAVLAGIMSHWYGTPDSAASGGRGFRLELKLSTTRVPVGSPLAGYVLAINDTGHPITIPYGVCDSWVQAGLNGPHMHFDAVSLLVGCASVHLATGSTRVPVTIPTTFPRCLQGHQEATPTTPHCRGHSDTTVPALPPGHYLAVIATQHLPITPTLPRPIPITIVAAR